MKRVLVVHNRYRDPGGEDIVFGAELGVLREHGHEVLEYERDNSEVSSPGLRDAAVAVWSSRARRELAELIRSFRPEIVHFHNIFFRISPSAYEACAEAGVPVVQTLHQYRLICPAGTQFRDGRRCTDCAGRGVAWPGVLHACYRDSRAQTALVAAVLAVHGLRRTWRRRVHAFIALSSALRGAYVEAGFPPERVHVKPNFLPTDAKPRVGIGGEYALFVGRLTDDKGILTLLEAWRHLSDIPLRLVGEGPLRGQVAAALSEGGLGHVGLTEWLSRAEVLELMRGARFVVVPSEWSEPFGLAVVEAFASGVPVIVSRAGALPGLVEEGRAGLVFEPGSAEELVAKASWAWQHREEMSDLATNGRQLYERLYTPEANYKILMGIYDEAVRVRSER